MVELPAPLLASGLAPSAQNAAAERPERGTWVAQAGGPLELKLRRLPDAVEVVVRNTGAAPQLLQTTRGATWLGQLQLAAPTSLGRGPQQVGLPEAGLKSVSLDGTGNVFRIEVTPMPGLPLGRPVVSADGRDLILTFNAPAQATLQTGLVDRNQPGRLPEPNFVPPLRPRAVAPPLGDIAVGTMLLRNPSLLTVSGPPVTMTLRNAPARDVLMSLAVMGNYGFVYVEDRDQAVQGGATPAAGGNAQDKRPVSIAFRNEPYGQAMNSVLLAAGLQGRREGNTIFAGPKALSKSLGNRLSKVYRLNQVRADKAADYLANLGARVTKTNTITTAVTEGANTNNAVIGGPNASTTQSSSSRTVEAYGADSGPLLGLQATTDSRLQSITLVGDPAIVAVAEQYLKQLDLRQRQVALTVRILDVTLDNDSELKNSFAFRYGNNFIVNDDGRMIGAFGSLLPPTADAFGRSYPKTATFEYNPASGVTAEAPIGYNIGGGINTTSQLFPQGIQASIFTDATRRNPSLSYPPDNFFNFVTAKIQSRSTKVLASPTLILSDNPETFRDGADQAAFSMALATGAAGASASSSSTSASATIGRVKANEAYVTVGEQIITNYTVVPGINNNPTTCQPVLGIAGLTFGARVSRIDDNGFVTFAISPSITAKVGSQFVPNCGPFDILAVRSLDSGSSRVRDGQTLIMTGVISDSDQQTVDKWPILGDMPIIGQFFRGSAGTRRKRELVILVTPRIINDVEGGTYGYGFQPGSREMRDMLRAPGS